MSDKKVLIRVQNLCKAFGGHEVLKNISVDINKGDVVCVIGPSGSGKSTFLRCLNRLEEPTGGHIFFDDVDIRRRISTCTASGWEWCSSSSTCSRT